MADKPMPNIMQFFAYAHLPEDKQTISRPFGEFAEKMVAMLPDNTERQHMLYRLLEAKDAAVRSSFQKESS